MAAINEGTFRQYRDGQDRMTAEEYMREREVLRLAINDLEDRLSALEGRLAVSGANEETPSS